MKASALHLIGFICLAELAGHSTPTGITEVSAMGLQEALVVEGRVVDSAGMPIQDAEITAVELGLSTRSAADGTFRLRVSRSGTYSLRVQRIGYEAKVIQAQVNGRVSLPQIRLRAVPQHLPDLAVEAKLPMPTFTLRPSMFVMRRLYSRALYWTWETHGAALSPNALAAIRYLEPMGPMLVTYGWYENISRTSGEFTVSSGACPRKDDFPLATAWVGLSDSIVMLYRSGDVWQQRRGHGLTTGACLRRPKLVVTDSILNAGPMLGGWLVISRDTSNRPHLSLHSTVGVEWATSPPSFLRSESDLRLAHIAPTALGATIAAPHWPFEWVEVNASGEARVQSRPFARLTDSSKYSRWTALPVLPITNGFVQTLLGPGARDRQIVVYTLLGRPIGLTQIAGAPGLIASDLLRRKLLGLRFSSAGKSRAEVVEYGY